MDRPRFVKLPFAQLALWSYPFVVLKCISFLARAWFWMVLAYFLILLLGQPPISGAVSRHAASAVILVCSVPFLVAWHRHVLLLDRARLSFRFGRREARFLALELTLMIVLSVPALIADSYGWNLRTVSHVHVYVLAFVVATIVLWLLSARLSLMFPAIAIDVPHFGAKHAWTLTRGSTLRLFAGFILLFIPLIPFGWMLGWSKVLVMMYGGRLAWLLLMPLIDVVFTFIYLGLSATYLSATFNWLVQSGSRPT